MERTSWGVFDEGAEEEKLNHPDDFFAFTLATEDELGDLVWDLCCVDPIALKGCGRGGGEPEIADVCVIGGLLSITLVVVWSVRVGLRDS